MLLHCNVVKTRQLQGMNRGEGSSQVAGGQCLPFPKPRSMRWLLSFFFLYLSRQQQQQLVSEGNAIIRLCGELMVGPFYIVPCKDAAPIQLLSWVRQRASKEAIPPLPGNWWVEVPTHAPLSCAFMHRIAPTLKLAVLNSLSPGPIHLQASVLCTSFPPSISMALDEMR